MQEEQKQYEKNEKMRVDVLEKDADVIEDVDLNEDKTTNRKDKIKAVDDS
jgi:hypothetical protein